MKHGFYQWYVAMTCQLTSWRLTKSPGQGLVEYAGALCIAGLLVGAVVLGTQEGSWMFTAYSAIVTAAGNMLVSMAGQIGA